MLERDIARGLAEMKLAGINAPALLY